MDNISSVSAGDQPLRPQAPSMPSAPQAPQDSISISGNKPEDIRKGYIKDLIFDRKKASQIDQFFDSESMKASFNRLEPDDRFPKGGWMIEYRNRQFTGSMPLRGDAQPGRIISDDEPGHRPFGRFTRTQDGWLGEAIVESSDPQSPIHRSMMTTSVGDDGRMEMCLMELNRDGGGSIYELDFDAYLKDPHCIPPIVDTYVFPPQDRDPQPPFPYHASPKVRELSTVGDFFGPGVPHAEVRRKPPSQYSPQGGWEVHIPNPIRMGDILINLADHQPAGYQSSSITEQPFGTWERIQGGWVSINNAKITPENFGQIRSSHLKTTLGDDGSILMTLYENYESGGGCAYELDVGEYLRHPQKPPPVLSSQPFAEGETVNETRLRAEAMEKQFAPKVPREDDNTIRVEDEWIVIGGVRLPVNQESGQS